MTTRTTRRGSSLLAAAAAALILVTTACGDDDDSTGSGDTEADGADETEATVTDDGDEADGGGNGSGEQLLDRTGDGTVQIAIATPGPRDDGAYYEALVRKSNEIAEANGFPDPIVVDNIPPAQAGQELENLAQQRPDVIMIGAGEIADPMVELSEQYPDIFWYCSCGQTGFGDSEHYALSQDDGSEINYTSGVATGLLLQESGGDSVTFIGCCSLGFEVESYESFVLGLQAVDESFTATYVAAGDFNDVAAATEAFNNALSEGADAVYPFLGGSHEPLVSLANENDVITMSAGASDACERDDLDYQIAIRFDAGDYLDTLFDEMLSGEFAEGMTRTFAVGVDEEVGAVICDPTPEQEAELQEAYDLVASGDLDDDFQAIKADAYGG